MNSSLLPHRKQSAPRTCLSSVVMEGDKQQYFTPLDPWSTSIISSPVPPHASGEDLSRFIGGWFWITSPQGNFPPNTHKSEVDLYPTYNRLYSLDNSFNPSAIAETGVWLGLTVVEFINTESSTQFRLETVKLPQPNRMPRSKEQQWDDDTFIT